MYRIENVRCEYMREPLAVSSKNPRFSWEVSDERSDVFQTGWQIVVKGGDGTVVWDSGIRQESVTVGIRYEGETLECGRRYQYRISSWNNCGEQSVSEGNYFETAPALEDWRAKWIEPVPLPQLPENPLNAAKKEWQDIMEALMRGEQAEVKMETDILEALPIEPFDPAVMMRKVFTLKGKAARARLHVSAHGIYEVMINGSPVTDSWLNPGFTSYDRRIRYQTFAVEGLMEEGENVIAATIADGWYKGKIAIGHGCEYGEIPGLLLQLEVFYENGENEIICTDGTWKYSFDGPVRSADLFMGEVYDAARADGCWCKKEYDDSSWEQAIEKEGPDVTLEAQVMPPVRVFQEIAAQKVWQTQNGDTVVDFGQNMAGVVRMETEGKPGEEIRLEYGEELDKDGNFFYVFHNSQTRAQRDIYICGGTGKEVFEPHFTYHGFRYVRVMGGGNWKKEQFTALAVSTDNPVTGSFLCSDRQLTRLQENIYWSQRSNNITIPTDCPTREKAGWTGDVVVYGETALYNQNMIAFYEDWLRSIRVEQKEDGQILNTVPQIRSYVTQAFNGSLGWGDVILTLPWQLYKISGDVRVLEENYEAMGAWIRAMEKAADELPNAYNVMGAGTADISTLSGRRLENQHYLINTGFHFGDWIIPSVTNEQGFTDGPLSSFKTMNYVDTSILAEDARLYAEISKALGKEENAEKYDAYSRRVKEAFCEEYVSGDGIIAQEMQGNYILALKYDMVPEEKRPLLAKRLNELIEKNDFRLDTGFITTPHILNVLCENGYQETAWKVLFQKKCPSWLYEVECGATTVWENWDAIREDGKLHDCSFNHYAFGCVGNFLYTEVLGIQNAGIGYEKIRIAPAYSCPLDWAEGSYHSLRGEIKVRWERKGEGFLISGRIPANTKAEVRLPNGEIREIGNGKFEIEV